MIKPFKINIPDKELEKIYTKVKNYPWHEMPDDGGWEYGTNFDYMKEISNYWVKSFDWRKHEAEINKFSNFKTNIDNIDIHFIHEKGSGPNPTPLLLMHGWPGSIVEFLHIIKGVNEILYPGQNKFNRYKNNLKKEIKISKNILDDLRILVNE